MPISRSVVISNPKLAKEIFTDSNYVGRPPIGGFDLYENERLGITSAEGDLWEVHRRFLLRQLREFGFGKSAMEALIMEEVEELIFRLRLMEGQPIKDVKKILNLAVVNALWTVVGGERFPHDDPKVLKLFENMNKYKLTKLHSR